MQAIPSPKEQTKEKILQSTEALLFSGGVRSTSVAKLMKQAGLTVGGFYAHFESKDALVLETFHRMLLKLKYKLNHWEGSIRDKQIKFIKVYLSKTHRDEPQTGCPLPAIAFEAALMDDPFRQKFTKELMEAFESRLQLLAPDHKPEERQRIMAEFCTMLGAQILARATKGTPTSDLILEVCQNELLKSKGIKS